MTCTEDAGGPHSECSGNHGTEQRAPAGPVMVGDMVDGERVSGFGYAPPPAPMLPSSHNDRLLTESDRGEAVPPRRLVPASRAPGPYDERLPHQRLPQHCVVPAACGFPSLPAAVNDLLTTVSSPWARVVDPIATTVRTAGHEVWLSGGAPRELLSGRGPEAVRDLDLTGTAPAGRFAELTRQALDEDGETYELRIPVSPDTLVCSVLGSDQSAPLVEYRGLGLGGFEFPATGTDLVADSRQRDFTVNSLLYDFKRHLVIDASERGLKDLAEPGRALVPVDTSPDPLVQASTALRAVKFLVRWETDGPANIRELRAWSLGFPDDLADRVRARGPHIWGQLRTLHDECVDGLPEDRQTAAGSMLGQGVEKLLKALRQEAE
ncbi:hypothetical protein OG223_17670 [Streptomyces sp. NBC_01478]|uniref:hypothetical protein n=1 Tax=Streptomyces sp. NBC_01478 TaxID=2903882 RepID=UPI002E2F55F7|nr:hypothetical protein [Streptomyces sp. NBC_01478]